MHRAEPARLGRGLSRAVDGGRGSRRGYLTAIVGTLLLSWLLTLKLGGAGVVAPHWLYVPIVLSAYRFGPLPTLLTSVVAGFLVGPLMPDHFAHGAAVAQPTSEWVNRAIDFVVLGQVMALLFRNLRRQQHAERASLYDPLTGLANRVLFHDCLERALARQTRSGGVLGVLFLDLDDFKAVNDRKGHGAGDDLLRAVSARLRGVVRSGEMLARLSGDEFAVIVEGADPNAPLRAAERLLEALDAPFATRQGFTAVHVSIGVADNADGGALPSDLLHKADLAMYSAKRAGKNRYRVYGDDLTSAC